MDITWRTPLMSVWIFSEMLPFNTASLSSSKHEWCMAAEAHKGLHLRT